MVKKIAKDAEYSLSFLSEKSKKIFQMKKYSILFICLLALSFSAMSQKSVISFDAKYHDFGKVNEEDGKITYVFEFTNKGNAPLVVNKVQTSCGCTTPSWTKEPVEPGKKGSITVIYNPSGRPGTFTKTITVYSNATDEQVDLIIKGEVIPKPTNEALLFPYNMNGLLLKAKVVQMNNIEKGRNQTRTITIKNSTKANLLPSFENLPPYLSAIFTPETLKPSETGKITFTLNSNNCTQWGPVSDNIYLVLNGQKKYSDDYLIKVVSNVVEDFSKLTLDQKRKAPILEMPSNSLNFGSLKPNSNRVGKFKIYNRGINPLEVRRIINDNKELNVRKTALSIAGGKGADIIINLNTKSLSEGDYKKTVTIQTNDPDKSFMILILSWKVQK
jgi:hypothetical protein